MNTTKDGLVDKLQNLIRVVDAICHGEKPADYPSELFALLKSMKEQGFIAEAPESYVTLPHEDAADETLRRHKGYTGIHPISQKLVDRKNLIAQAANPAGIYNFKVLGLDPYFRLKSENMGTQFPDPVEAAQDAAVQILPRGDIHSLRQALHILRAKLDHDVRVRDTALIIQNSRDGFWNPLFSYLGIKTPRSTALEKEGVFVTLFPGAAQNPDDTRASTLTMLKTIGQNMDLAARPDRMGIAIKPGDALYVASGSAHKPIEVRDALEEMRARLRVESLNGRVDIKPREAEEDNFSLEGNNFQKMMETIEIINTQGFDNVCRMLCPAGKGPESVYLVFDDRGLSFLDQRVMLTQSFSPTHSQLNPLPYKDAPGAELAPVLKTHSRKRFFEDMLAGAIDEIAAKTPDQPADLTVLDAACHITVRLDWLRDAAQGQPLKYIATMATRRSVAITHAQPPALAAQTDNYLYPVTYNENVDPAKIRTKAEITRYVTTSSEVAGSLRTLAAITGIDEHANDLKGYNLSYQFRKNALGKDEFGRPKKYEIATIYSCFPSIKGHGTPSLPAAMNGSFKLISGDDARYDLEPFINPKVVSIDKAGRANDTHRDEIEVALGRLRRLYQDADGFILSADNPNLKKIPGMRWLKTLFYYSLVVGKQVDDRAIKAKFFGLLDKGDKSWTTQRRMFDYLGQTPLLLNRYEDVLSDYTSNAALKQAMQQFRASYVRPGIPEKDIVRKTDGVKMPEDMYRVTIYCSASLGKDTPACHEAREFTFNLAQNGFGIINGGGREGLMVATSEGVHAFRALARKQKLAETPRTHVTSYQCHDTYEREGGWHEKNDDAVIFQTIEQRMANLMNTDAEVLMAGGAGSIQEIAASLLMREWGMVPVKNRPLVIVNQKMDGIPAFTPLINMIRPQDFKRLNIHVVDTIAQAAEVLKASRAAMQADLGAGAVYAPAAARLQQAAPAQKAQLHA